MSSFTACQASRAGSDFVDAVYEYGNGVDFTINIGEDLFREVAREYVLRFYVNSRNRPSPALVEWLTAGEYVEPLLFLVKADLIREPYRAAVRGMVEKMIARGDRHIVDLNAFE